MAGAPTWETVYERNSVERIKRDRPPLGIREELPALIAAGYERMPEEDFVRLQWWGLYHDKPKIGTFMLRVKMPAGILSPAKLRTIGEVSNRYGRGDAELTTRQSIQLHWLELAALPDVFAALEAAGMTTRRRLRRHGPQHHRLPGLRPRGATSCSTSTPVVDAATGFFYGNPDYSTCRASTRYSIAACPAPLQRARDQLRLARRRDPRRPRGLRRARRRRALHLCRGSRATSASSSRVEEAMPRCCGAVLDVWKEDLANRMSRVKARLKFMVDDLGPEGMRERVEARLGTRPGAASSCPRRARPARPHRRRTPRARGRALPTSASRSSSGSSPATSCSRSPTSRRSSAATSG